jgi:hypothetical protein
MDTAKYFQNGLHRSLKFGTPLEALKFYYLRFFQFFNIICFEDTRLNCFFLNGTGGQI